MTRPSRVPAAWTIGVALLVGGTLSFPPAGIAQNVVELTGTVVDSVSLEPVAEVSLVLEGVGIVALTDVAGRFRLVGVPTGPQTITVRRPGYVSRAYRFSVTPAMRGIQDVGVLLMRVGDEPTAQFGGSVMSTVGQPVERATVVVDGRVVSVTDAAGAFQVDGVSAGTHLFEVRRIGFVPSTYDLEVRGDGPPAHLSVVLGAMPIELAEIVVEGERTILVSGRMRDFYRRRKVGVGTFFTRSEIETANPMDVSDLFRMVSGIRLTPGQFGRRIITMSRGSCQPQIYVDGFNLLDFDLDEMLHPDQIEAIELYRSGMVAPPQFSGLGTCGAIVIWTR